MDATLCIEVLEKTLLPFLTIVYPDSSHFMADNDPKHTFNDLENFRSRNKVTWWRTPTESPDCNPIENLRHKVKEYNRCFVKPTTKKVHITKVSAS